MTLEEAIRHAEEKAKCGWKCGEEHEQLAMWLKELKMLQSAQPKIEERNGKSVQNVPKEDLISRKAAIDALIWKIRPHNNGDGTITMCVMSEELVRKTLNDLPAAQPEIIRCKECLMHGVCRFEQGLGLDGYCSQAERRTE